ncbi:MAG: AAA family ATPase, partial [Prevotellaceae bacterium]|nr:AAA family ATPase [Prevotellaceae bacterium]
MSVLDDEKEGFIDLGQGQGQEPEAEVPAWERGIEDVDDAGWFDIEQPYFPPDYTLRYKTASFAPLGGIHALTGQSGHGKTMTFSLLMAALLRGEYQGIDCIMPQGTPVRILYVDTEMEARNTLTVVARLLYMTGTDLAGLRERLRVINLRDEVEIAANWRRLRRAILDYCPTVVFVDGMLDMVEDFNSNEECQKAVRRVMALASLRYISVWCLVHENPGSTKMVGHMGSALERKVTDIFEAKKEKQGGAVTFCLRHVKARGKDVDDIYFHVVEEDVGGFPLGVPRIIETTTVSEVAEALAHNPKP